MHNNIVGVIPARYNSQRLPGKPLVKIGDKSMIQRVWEQAKQVKLLHELIIATDDARIVDEVNSFGGRSMLTSTQHVSGTDRVAEITENLPNAEIIINIQGDMPFISPLYIDTLILNMLETHCTIGTLFCKRTYSLDTSYLETAKIVLNQNNQALMFSRQLLPLHYLSNKQTALLNEHIGIYGFKKSTLFEISKLPPAEIELAEKLEQLRWLYYGYEIQCAEVTKPVFSIDTPEQLLEAQKLI